MVCLRHILHLSILICFASAAAFSQTTSSPQFIAASQLLVHGPLPGALGGVGIVTVADFNRDHRADILTSFGQFNSSLILYTQNSDGSFTAGKPIQLPAGNPKNGTLAAPDSVTVADINGDGIPDLVVGVASDLNQNERPDDNGAIYIYLGSGNGAFRQYASFSVGESGDAVSATVVDPNGKGRPDLLVVSYPNNVFLQTRVYLNQGDGSFRAGQSLGTNMVLATGAFSGNGRMDLVVLNPLNTGISQSTPNFQILKGNGDGTFSSGAIYSVPGVSIVTVGDVNGDHNLDLVVTNSSDALAPPVSTVMLGNGDGTFRRAGAVPTVLFNGAFLPNSQPDIQAAVPRYVYIADFNRDGNPDLAVVSGTIGTDPQNALLGQLGEVVAIYLGNGTGTFGNPRIYNVDSQASSVALADINGNGKLDFLMAGDTFSLIAGDGYGNFRAPVTSPSFEPTSIAAADFNRDGIPDIAVVSQPVCRSCGISLSADVTVFPGSGKGYLRPAKVYPIGLADGIIAVGDVNGDGKPDIVVVRRGRLNDPGNNPPVDTSVLLGRGNGTFEPAMNFTLLGMPAVNTHDTSAFLVDINHDGKLDLVGDWGVAFGRGNGTFKPPIPLPSGIHNIAAMALADFNRDGYADLAIATSVYGSQSPAAPATLYTLLGNGKGQFRIVQEQQGSVANLGALTAVDINHDGIPDLIFTTQFLDSSTGFPSAEYLNAELGKGNGTFANGGRIALDPNDFFPLSAVADFDRDGNPDIALSDTNGTLELFRGTGRGSFLPPTSYDVLTTSMAVTNLDNDGAPDIAGTTPAGVVRLINTGHRNYAAAAKPPAP